MGKVIKQIAVNVVTMMISVLILYIVKSVNNGVFLDIPECFGADFVFIMISALATTAGWRFAEGIKIHWIYNLFLCAECALLLFEYGFAIGNAPDLLTFFIQWTAIAFIVFYLVENVFIGSYFIKAERQEKRKRNNCSYKEREE